MFANIIKAVVLGIVEGVTEFLPISSTGHLILINRWIHFGEPFTAMFDVVIQLGAILAVVIYFWKRLWPFGKDKSQTRDAFAVWLKVITGVIPAIVLGALFGQIIEEKLFNPFVAALSLFVGGIILIYIEKNRANYRFPSIYEMPLKIAFYIGLIQCVSMIPGTSRAAATIIGAMILGASRKTAVEFSFFLAIPTMAAASAYSLLKHGFTTTVSEFAVLAIGFVTAFITAFGVIRFLLKYIQRHDFKLFGYYRIALGALILMLIIKKLY